MFFLSFIIACKNGMNYGFKRREVFFIATPCRTKTDEHRKLS